MDYQKDTTHVVIKFFEKSKTGQTSIDLVPVTWTHLKDGQLFCKYPNKSEYLKVNKLSKTSSEPGASWKSFKVILVKEASNYEQGIRRMKRGYSDEIIESSNIDEYHSSEKEEDPLQLTGNDLKKSLNKIPSLKGNFKSTHKNYREDNSDTSVSHASKDEKSSVDNSDTSSSTSSLKTKKTFKKHNRHDSQNATSSSNSSSSIPSPKKRKTQSTKEKSVSSDSLQTLSSETQDNATKTSAETQKSSIRSKVIDPKQKAKKKLDVSKTAISSTSKKNKKDQTSKKRYNSCPTCGRTAPSKSFLESMKRSIEYRIRDESEKIRGTIAASKNSGYIENIMEEGRIADLPKDDLDSFLQFEDDLKKDEDLVKKVKCFMVLNTKNSMRLSENLSIVIPRIITKNVQLLYSAFGRETNGVQKLNFSKTETYKYLRVILTKCPELQLKELNSQFSRWFSGAKDREGGKKERNLKKTQRNEG
ncbi:dentin sialophosphoprotein-like isoform X2 [Temnothorax curvispinosus]|uniref:Dentin sialophosphoprotein-like isoform X2 n=1 Tax=Temnothorax curvispinosus TaxID=300111 RepID=A0A6J1R2D3_9HYME|nr:dentin sialophosphoprotein-like isoform X2 [Temnothorax curvispinosus]